MLAPAAVRYISPRCLGTAASARLSTRSRAVVTPFDTHLDQKSRIMLSQAVAQYSSCEPRKDLPVSRLPFSANEQSDVGQRILGVSKSAGNALRGSLSSRNLSQPVKRTISGLSKVVSNSGGFEDGSSGKTAERPFTLKSTAVPSVTQSEFFSENDFDSDLELDVEDLTCKVPLPSQKSTAAIPQTNPPASNIVASCQASRQAVSRDTDYNATLPPPSSSDAAVPWSSSPPEHYGRRPGATLGHFAFSAPIEPRSKDVVGPPAKRRTLPWARQDKEPAQPPVDKAETQPHCDERLATHIQTPTQTVVKSKSEPWNNTLSAHKDNKKSLREAIKAKTKVNKATDEDLAAVRKRQENKVAKVFLSQEQQQVCNLVLESRKSVFFTGSAGTGKSVLLRQIIDSLRRKHTKEPDRIAVTASTGLAACNIGGVTLHSFAGIGLGKEDIPELVKKIKRNAKAKHRWLRTKVLVVDEISMVDGDLFDKLEGIARNIRKDAHPFGGIQLVITGDFFQLPPVPDNNRMATFAFDASTWSSTIHHTIGLHHVFRQKDPVFAGMLNEMREGRLTPSSIQAFKQLCRPLPQDSTVVATELFSTRQEVDTANSNRMMSLVGESKRFEAHDGGKADITTRDRLLSNCMAPKVLDLKKGSQVMLIKNVDETLVNGSVGKVVGFMSETRFDLYNQQGGMLNGNEGDEPSTQKDKTAPQAPRIASFVAGNTTSPEYPIVRFPMENGTTRDMQCLPEQWTVELPNREVQASRTQVPLILAWALSIHKAQGQTLEKVKVNLSKVFEKGQAYVALSRATTITGLQVLGFDASRVMAHDKVRTFYSNLGRVEELEEAQKRSNKTNTAGLTAKEYESRLLDGHE